MDETLKNQSGLKKILNITESNFKENSQESELMNENKEDDIPSEKLSMKKRIRSLRFDEPSESELKSETEGMGASFDKMPLKKEVIDKIMLKNQKRRLEEKERKKKREDWESTSKGFRNAEKLTSKLNTMNKKLDSYLAQKIKPVIRRKKRKKKIMKLPIEEIPEERESLRKYRQIGVNSKWMRTYKVKPLEKMEEEEEELREEELQVEEEVKVEVNENVVEENIEREIVEQEIVVEAFREELKVEVNQEAVKTTENVKKSQATSKIISDTNTKNYDDVRVLGQIKGKFPEKELSLRTEVKSRMMSGFVSREFGYDSAFDKSQQGKSVKGSPLSRSHVIEIVRNPNLAEDELLSMKKASQTEILMNQKGKKGIPKQISISTMRHGKYAEMKGEMSEESSEGEEEGLGGWEVKGNKSVPLELAEPSTLFDLQKEKERVKYEILVKKEKEIKEKILRQKQEELMQMIRNGEEKKYKTFELDKFLEELDGMNVKLEKYMKEKKKERREKKEEKKEKKMLEEAERQLEKEKEEKMKKEMERLNQMENKRYENEEMVKENEIPNVEVERIETKMLEEVKGKEEEEREEEKETAPKMEEREKEEKKGEEEEKEAKGEGNEEEREEEEEGIEGITDSIKSRTFFTIFHKCLQLTERVVK